MPNSNRLHITGQTYFVLVERRTGCSGFYDDACYQFYLLRLLNCINAYHVRLHAYFFQANEIWLLVTPGTPTGVTSLLRFLNQAYSNYFNARFDRSVNARSMDIWSNTIVSSLIQGNSLVLDCQKYIERAAFSRGVVTHPGAYKWSSYCANSFGGALQYLTPHPAYNAFIEGIANPHSHYRDFISIPFNEAYCLYLESRLKFGLPLAKREQELALPITRKRVFWNQNNSKSPTVCA